MSLSKTNLIYVINGRIEDGNLIYSSFVQSQFDSVKEHFENSEILILSNNTNFFSILKNIRETRKKIPTNALVHAQYGTVTSLIAAFSKKKNPFVISLCGDDIIGSSSKKILWIIRGFLGRQFSIFSCYFSDHIIAKSNSLKDKIPNYFLSKTTILPNGVNRCTFFPIDKISAKAKLGWDSNTIYILFNPSSGNNSFVKNLPLAQNVVNKLKAGKANIELALIKSKTAEEINLMMNAADSLLVTSFHEGSPNIVKEAMACNLPIVSVDCGDVVERLKSVNNSYVAKSYDDNELCELVMKVLNSDSRSNGCNMLEEDGLYSDQVANKLISLYNSII